MYQKRYIFAVLIIQNMQKINVEGIRNSKDIIKLLEEKGWQLDRVKGSHHTFKHNENKYLITVPHPRKDIPIGTIRAILKTAGVL